MPSQHSLDLLRKARDARPPGAPLFMGKPCPCAAGAGVTALRVGLIVVAVLALGAAVAYARAGGGGGYSGGGGGFSGGGGGGGGDGEILFYLIWLAIRYPAIGVPALLIFLGVSFFGGRKVQDHRVTRTIVRATRAQAGSDRNAKLAEIRARDAGFDLTAFLGRARSAFVKIQEGWCAHDLGKVRPFISDGVMQRFSIQIAMQKTEGLRNKMEQIKIIDCSAVKIECDPHFDTIHVRVHASAVDTFVSSKDGSKVRGSGRAEEFVEVWSFLRRPGAKTTGKAGLIEGFCPSCGAPLPIGDCAQCESCKSWVNSGQYDWVLAEITQACEWEPGGLRQSIPGLAHLTERDPALNAQFIEDRASLSFWLWQSAQWKGNTDSLKAVANDGFCRTFASERKDSPYFYWNVAVGGVDLLAVEAGEPMDKVHILVKWSGKWFEIKDGKAVYRDQVLRQHVLVFERRAGVKTDAGSGLRSMRCAGCGAPPSEGGLAKCEFCGAAFNDGSRQWVLASVTPGSLWRRPAVAGPAGGGSGAVPVSSNATDALAALIWGMMSDGHMDARELKYLETFAGKHAIPRAKLDEVMGAVKSGQMRVTPPADPIQARLLLDDLIRMCLADGKVSRGESLFLSAYGKRLSMSPQQVEKLIVDERTKLYKQSQQTLARS